MNIESPLRRILDEHVEQGMILMYALFVDRILDHTVAERVVGVRDIRLEVMPAGRADTFLLQLDMPEFKPESGSAKRCGSGRR